MTRIVAGEYGGRRLQTPPGDGTRPTTDRVREAMFSSLQSELGGFANLRVLDLFAGSGALGLEALSRGAAAADFVESDTRVAGVIKRNIADLGCAGATVLRTTVERFLRVPPREAYDLVFLDPPYALPTAEVATLVATLVVHEWRTPESVVVVERSTRDPFAWPEGVEGLRDRAYGETHLWYGR
ncbi:MAG: rsmD [Aeromicrobium sp.]|nr:rsmD [Aeromicrobium sp.]